MSAFKRISVSDSFVVPYTANKSWNIPYASLYNKQITINTGTNYGVNHTFSPFETTSSGQYNSLVYRAVNTTYYPNFLPKYVNTSSMYGTIYNDGTLSTSSYYNGFVELGNLDTIKYFPTESGSTIYTINIPRQLSGDKIIPSTFELSYVSASVVSKIYDDGNYNLRYSGSNTNSSIGTILSQSSYVGNIFYEQNIAILNIIPTLLTSSIDYIDNISFQNNHIVYENFVKCTIKDYEYNASYNPTLLSGSQGLLIPYSSSNNSDIVYISSEDNFGILKDFSTGSISGSEFSPYVTTVGLYNDAQDLLAVAKMASPIPIPSNTDMTFLVKWDTNFISKSPLYIPSTLSALNIASFPSNGSAQSHNGVVTGYIGQTFTIPVNNILKNISFSANINGSPDFDIQLGLYNLAGGSPNTQLDLSSNIISVSTLPTGSNSLLSFNFNSTLTGGSYAFILIYSNVVTNNGSNRIDVLTKVPSSVYSGGVCITNNGLGISGPWTFNNSSIISTIDYLR